MAFSSSALSLPRRCATPTASVSSSSRSRSSEVTGAGEIVDERAREQVAPQAFERGTQERVREREAARSASVAAAPFGTADDRDDRDERVRHRCAASRCRRADCRRARAARRRRCRSSRGVRQNLFDEVGEIRAGGRLARPAHLAVRVEDRDAGRARQQRADQLCVRFERAPGIRSLAARPSVDHSWYNRYGVQSDGRTFSDTGGAKCCASWRMRASAASVRSGDST